MESGKIIVVANQKGGVAKTSTVRNLSYALAEMGKKVLVVDFDPQYNLTTSFGVLPTQAPYNTGTLITNLLLDESLPDTNEFIQKIGSVDLIPSSRSLTVAEANLLMTPDSNDYLAALLNPLRLSYDYIMAKFEYMQRAFSSELKPRARLVLQVLVLHCNKEGECFPSIKTIRPGQTICFPPSEKNGRKSCFRRLRPHSSRLLRLARHPQRFPLWISCTSGLSTSTSLLPDG